MHITSSFSHDRPGPPPSRRHATARPRAAVAVAAAAVLLTAAAPAALAAPSTSRSGHVPAGPRSQPGYSLTTAVPAAPKGSAHGLSNETFTERGYGIRFHEPASTRKVLQTVDGALVKFLFRNGATMSFYMRRSGHSLELILSKGSQKEVSRLSDKSDQLTLEQVRKQALNQFSFAYPSARQVKDDHPSIKIAGRWATKIYFLVPDSKHGNWVAGQAFLLINPETVAMFQMQCDADDFKKIKSIFEAMLHSVRMEDYHQLIARRRQQLRAGRIWLKAVTAQRIGQALVPEQWYRIVQQGKDVGYVRVTEHKTTQMDEKGVAVVKQLRIYAGKAAYDTIETDFASNDGTLELWSVRSTRRDAAQAKTRLPRAGPAPKTLNWVETGLRSGSHITVSRQTPTSFHKQYWTKPSISYLSQAELEIVMPMLPHVRAGRYAFYAYDSATHQLALRLVWVKPLPGGKFQVTIRRTPDRAPIVCTYSPAGRLLRRQLPDGRTILPTTRRQLRQLWNLPDATSASPRHRGGG